MDTDCWVVGAWGGSGLEEVIEAKKGTYLRLSIMKLKKKELPKVRFSISIDYDLPV